MARCLIVACGCRGRGLATELRARGHAVRGTTRDPGSFDAIAAAGAEPFLGDPDRVSTVAPAFAQTAVACFLLGSATGSPQSVRELHDTRLDMLMEKLIDTTVRGVVYEAAGTVAPDVLAHGAGRVRWWCERSLIPYRLLDADPADPAWAARAADLTESVLLSE